MSITRAIIIVAIIAVALVAFNMWSGKPATIPGA